MSKKLYKMLYMVLYTEEDSGYVLQSGGSSLLALA